MDAVDAVDAVIGVLVMAYGGPNNLDEVEPYLLDVRGFRPTAPEIVHEVRERYRAIGGRSPILERTRAQAAALEAALNARARGAPPEEHDDPFRPFQRHQPRATGISLARGISSVPSAHLPASRAPGRAPARLPAPVS